MYRRLLILGCKILIKILRASGRNGSALPGLVIERLNPRFLELSLNPHQSKIILVTGTNGKTTTTKMLVTALRGQGLRVVTNTTGSNMTRGLIAALVEDMTLTGKIKPTDWFVFEMDEAYAPIFTESLSPKVVLALNVLRDQLDRYGEIDRTAQLIERAAAKADIYLYNQLDPLLVSAAHRLSKKGTKVYSFGVAKNLSKMVANEQTLHSKTLNLPKSEPDTIILTIDESESWQWLTVDCGEQGRNQFSIPVQGFHNALNAAAVTSVLTQISKNNLSQALKAISDMPIPFGRGEKLHIRGKSITVALVKNPSGFTSNLKTFIQQNNYDAVVFIVNDKLADGRDVSWLWDVEFKPFLSTEIALFTSGIRAYDMSVRLKQDGFKVETDISVAKIIDMIMKSDFSNVAIIPTYTALFEARTALAKYGKVPRIW